MHPDDDAPSSSPRRVTQLTVQLVLASHDLLFSYLVDTNV